MDPYVYYNAILLVSTVKLVPSFQEIAWTGRRLKAYFSAGGILWIFCGAVVFLLPRNMSYAMYIASVFIGIANALMMV